MPSPATAETTAIHPVRKGDLPHLSEPIRERARYEQAGALRPDLDAALPAMPFSASPRLHVLLAIRGEALIGYASWILEASTWHAAEYAHLDCPCLRDTDRVRGTDRELMRAVTDAAHAARAREFQWLTPDWNDGAIRFIGAPVPVKHAKRGSRSRWAGPRNVSRVRRERGAPERAADA